MDHGLALGDHALEDHLLDVVNMHDSLPSANVDDVSHLPPLWKCSASKCIYVPTHGSVKCIQIKHIGASGLLEGSPDESDRIGRRERKKAYLGGFRGGRVPTWVGRIGR